MITIWPANRIDEIKHIREYTSARYGFASGLKESKDLIDYVMASQMEEKGRKEKQFLEALRQIQVSLDALELPEGISDEYIRASWNLEEASHHLTVVLGAKEDEAKEDYSND